MWKIQCKGSNFEIDTSVLFHYIKENNSKWVFFVVFISFYHEHFIKICLLLVDDLGLQCTYLFCLRVLHYSVKLHKKIGFLLMSFGIELTPMFVYNTPNGNTRRSTVTDEGRDELRESATMEPPCLIVSSVDIKTLGGAQWGSFLIYFFPLNVALIYKKTCI